MKKDYGYFHSPFFSGQSGLFQIIRFPIQRIKFFGTDCISLGDGVGEGVGVCALGVSLVVGIEPTVVCSGVGVGALTLQELKIIMQASAIMMTFL